LKDASESSLGFWRTLSFWRILLILYDAVWAQGVTFDSAS
jgi:hypothetical protein